MRILFVTRLSLSAENEQTHGPSSSSSYSSLTTRIRLLRITDGSEFPKRAARESRPKAELRLLDVYYNVYFLIARRKPRRVRRVYRAFDPVRLRFCSIRSPCVRFRSSIEDLRNGGAARAGVKTVEFVSSPPPLRRQKYFILFSTRFYTTRVKKN